VNPRYWLAFIVAAIGWGTGGIATRAAFDRDVGGWTMVTMRIVIAALLVVLLLLVQRRLSIPDRTTTRVGLMMALYNLAIPYVVFTFAYDNASAGFVGLLAALIPLVTALFARAMLPDEPLTGPKLTGLALGFAGVAALLLSGSSGLESGGRPVVAAGLSFIGVVSIGYASVYAKKHAAGYDPTEVTGLQFLFAGALLVFVMLGTEGAPTDVSGAGWALILYMAVAASFLPFVIFFRLIQRVPVTTVSLIGYLVPLVALIGGVLLLNEQLQAGIVVGGLLILAGVIVADRANRRAAVSAAS
jgi:drug/metabolite transporter (DMT)-like permease